MFVPGPRELQVLSVLVADHLPAPFSRSFNVSGGSFEATVEARNAIAIHTGAAGKGNHVSVVFLETASTTVGEVYRFILEPHRI